MQIFNIIGRQKRRSFVVLILSLVGLLYLAKFTIPPDCAVSKDLLDELNQVDTVESFGKLLEAHSFQKQTRGSPNTVYFQCDTDEAGGTFVLHVIGNNIQSVKQVLIREWN